MPDARWAGEQDLALLTDLYELTMAASYFRAGMDYPATFDLFVRRLPPERRYLVVAGIEDAIDYLARLRFSDEDVAYLRALALFDDPFLAYLERFRFRGDVWAIPEGEVAFANEPLVRVTAPLIEAQIVETLLMNTVHFQTLVASKATRVVFAAGGRPVVDFSPRRDHGASAALKVARASAVAGVGATSNVLAGRLYGLPVSGTMAHSYVMSFQTEREAFLTFARHFPGRTTLLIDTYNTLQAAHTVVDVVSELEPGSVQAVRLDSGDLGALARGVRAILDAAGLHEVRIFASGDLDEYRISALLGGAAPAPIDAFGVGTRMGTSADVPSLPFVYKLVEDSQGPRVKLSPGKATLPGRKQVYRQQGDEHLLDVLALATEQGIPGRPLLEEYLAGGRRVRPPESLEVQQKRCEAATRSLPAAYRSLSGRGPRGPLVRSPELRRMTSRAREAARVAGGIPGVRS